MGRTKKEQEDSVELNEQPPQPIFPTRNTDGLIEGLEYPKDDFGLIDWSSMIPKKFLVVNDQNFKDRGKDVPSSIEGLDPRDVLILLGGSKYLARIRGIEKIEFPEKIVDAHNNYATVTCRLTFIDNIESINGFTPKVVEGTACAHFYNTYDFTKNYLVEIASNRAFCRALNYGLGLNMISKEEIGPKNLRKPDNNQSDNSQNFGMPTALSTLKSIMSKAGISFEKVKARCVELEIENSNNWEHIDDIPEDNAFFIAEKIKEKLNQK